MKITQKNRRNAEFIIELKFELSIHMSTCSFDQLLLYYTNKYIFYNKSYEIGIDTEYN